MAKSYSVIYVHFVWATWDRLPLLSDEIEVMLFDAMRAEAERLSCGVVAAGGVADHVHLLLQLPATLCVADAAKHIKGASAFVANESRVADSHFKWQGSYSAFSISRWDIKKVTDYIVRQKEHHAAGTTKPSLEGTQ